MVTIISSSRRFLGCFDLKTGVIVEICCFNWVFLIMFLLGDVGILLYGLSLGFVKKKSYYGLAQVSTFVAILPHVLM